MFHRDVIFAGAVAALAALSGTPARANPAAPPSHAVAAALRSAEALNAPAKAAAPARFDFITPPAAASRMARTRAVPIDTRPVAKFLAAHIPGAVHLDDESLRRSARGTPATLLPPEQLADLFASLGVSPTVPAVVYSDHDDPLAATLAAYALLRAGHRDVSVLDGGFSAWQGSQPTTAEFTVREPADRAAWNTAPPADPPHAATIADVRRFLDTRELSMIDARPPRLFRGEGRNWARNGHIPGAANLDWTTLTQPDNQALLKPRAEIERLIKALAAADVAPEDETLIYCGTGREATMLYLYLRYKAGWKRVRLYEGSWTEYQSDPDRPVMTGTDRWVPIHSDGEITLSAQPTEATLRELSDRGVRLVINCRTPSETAAVGFPMKAAAEALGMKYLEIPLGGAEGYDPKDVQTLHEALTAHGGTDHLHLHCASGTRAANLWMAYLIKERNMPPAEAAARMRKAGVVRESALERLLGRDLEYQWKRPEAAPAPEKPAQSTNN